MRLKGAYGSQDFLSAYRAALAEKPVGGHARGEGTFEWLWDLYRASPKWTNLSPKTRRLREWLMSSALKRAGNQPLDRWTRQFILASCDSRSETPGAARNFLDALKGMFAWAVDRGYLDSNPASGLSVEIPDSEGFHTWTAEEMATFESKWPLGTRQRLAYDVLLWTGLRRSDAVVVGQKHVTDGVISFKTSKTGAVVTLRMAPPLVASLRATAAGRETFIAREDGEPHTGESFSHWFKKACLRAKVPGTSHGLRKALAVKLAEGGGTHLQIGAVLGNNMAALYARMANKVKLSDAAFEKLFPLGQDNDEKPE